jgi:hypothetical protein
MAFVLAHRRRVLKQKRTHQSVHWALGMHSTWSFGLGDVRKRSLAQSVANLGYYSGFELFLLPNIIHTHPAASNVNRWVGFGHPYTSLTEYYFLSLSLFPL